jgi:ubiquinone/menaquinone biosynthesis C-methylase UbiE
MLARAGTRAKRHGLSDIVDFRLSDADRLGLEGPLDFVLAFWMLHEVGDPKAFLAEIRSALKPGGRLLMVEPKVHVPRGKFLRSVELARSVGFQVKSEPRVWFSRSTLFSSAAAPAG